VERRAVGRVQARASFRDQSNSSPPRQSEFLGLPLHVTDRAGATRKARCLLGRVAVFDGSDPVSNRHVGPRCAIVNIGLAVIEMRGGNIVVRHGQNFGLGFRRADQSVKFWCGVNTPSVLRALRRGAWRGDRVEGASETLRAVSGQRG
jgi:hypothetical protein